MRTPFFGILLSLLLVACSQPGGSGTVPQEPQQEPSQEASSSSSVSSVMEAEQDGAMEESKAMEEDTKEQPDAMEESTEQEVMMEKKEEEKSAVELMAKGEFTAFTNDVLVNGATKVLFFHASWCPKCLANEEKLTGWYESENIPLSTYLIDYDSSAALKTKYGVVQQDTFVLVDENGNKIKSISFPKESALRSLLWWGTL